MPALTYEERPRELQHPAVKGVFVGGCVERGDGSRFRAKAHAHDSKTDPYCGWLCFLSAKRLSCRELLLHELAHLIAKAGHVDKWRKVLLDLGGTLDEVYDEKGKLVLKSYHKRARGVRNG